MSCYLSSIFLLMKPHWCRRNQIRYGTICYSNYNTDFMIFGLIKVVAGVCGAVAMSKVAGEVVRAVEEAKGVVDWQQG